MQPKDYLEIVVCGLHMRGFALEYQLLELGGTFLEVTQSAPVYQLFELPYIPPKPGMIRNEKNGSAIEVEVWQLPSAHVGRFLEMIPPPLGLGKVELMDGRILTGFICEPYGIDGATDITTCGGWRYR